MKSDPGLQWIRDVRVALSNELDNNPQRFIAFLKEHQDARKANVHKRSVTVKDDAGRYNDR
ncbi:MAG: hypothetical protein BWX80_00932 [Candidatus Hydrogenedentes bacterium ADurb.Bin101]|jgi:hypothetical protein|nr:MAG: hypothetical protein BWX80_00932 [Candidatus Hydrogenedentes bacterium ADurb.Bin101]HOC70048.1 hypothetical protein [Candidatus Hydrogenedentota bacterium]